MEIDQLQHADSIWTWRPNNRRRKASLWLPYFQSVERLPKGKGDKYRFVFKGGEVECHLKQIDFLMFYGASGDLPVEFLDKLNAYRIPLMIHRRNMPRPYMFFPEIGEQDADVLTPQILNRQNKIKSCYIARTLIRERLRKFEDYISISETSLKALKQARRIQLIRKIEADASRRFWSAWFIELGHPKLGRRERKNPVNEALNAGSFFLYGVILRWVLFHKMSPCHGYLHQPTTYPALVYDLIEPYRYIIEESVKEAIKKYDFDTKEKLVGASIEAIKRHLENRVYVPATHQSVAEKNLLHGVVMALRSYLIGETKRFVIPIAGVKKGGRPPKIGYKLPGER